ncbi:MAG: outer membrane protein TolC [Roseivirga sp.]|jgi:outer membrane protein TolC
MKKELTILLLFGLSFNLFAQKSLTLKEAVQLGLEYNLAIRISEKIAETSANNSALSYGALLPTFGVTANKSFSDTDVTQQLANSNEVRRINDAKTNNLNLSPTLNWTIFDGFGMFYTRDRLKVLARVGEDDLKIQIENSIAQISNAFYRVVLEDERARVFQSALDLSKRRLELAKTRYEVGKASKLIYLQAQVDYNTDSSNFLIQRELIHNVKIEMNRLMGQGLEDEYKINAGFDFDDSIVLDEMLSKAYLNNPTVLRAQRDLEVNFLQMKEINAQKFPVVNVNLGYTYNDRNSDAGAVLSNLSTGINYGVGASFSIFNGFDIKRRQQNAKIQQELTELQIDDLRLSLESDIRKTYGNYQNSLRLNQLEQLNLEVAKENYDIALERFKVGNSTPIELREAQINLIQAEIRKLLSQYNIKLAEIELKRLAGSNVN